ncbi:MAG: hypothetical protein Q8S33_13260 [Myxococcales bacterium]|nr:hypothetical protein [Myxococcales bacterium]MDP3501307.1 hypothetical protein [Myxococcales bacterium]
MKDSFEGREAQFHEMMEQLSQLQAKYKGVRGELLAKVREEFEKLKPTRNGTVTSVRAAPVARATPARPVTPAATATPATARATPARPLTSPATAGMLPSCRVCGRTMKQANDNSLVCQNGHIRLAS